MVPVPPFVTATIPVTFVAVPPMFIVVVEVQVGIPFNKARRFPPVPWEVVASALVPCP